MRQGRRRGVERAFDIEYLGARLEYNPETGELRWRAYENASLRWNSRWAGTLVAMRRTFKLDGVQISKSRVIWALMKGDYLDDDLWLLHLDCNESNYQWDNLVAATHEQMVRNSPKLLARGSRCIKEYWGKYQLVVYIDSSSRYQYVGTFETFAEAARERDRLQAEAGYGSIRG